MSLSVIYATGSGGTEFVAKQIKQAFQKKNSSLDVKLLNVHKHLVDSKLEKVVEMINESDIVAFGTYVDCGKLCRPLNALFEELPDDIFTNKKTFSFCTSYSNEMRVPHIFAVNFSDKGGRGQYFGNIFLKCPESYLPLVPKGKSQFILGKDNLEKMHQQVENVWNNLENNSPISIPGGGFFANLMPYYFVKFLFGGPLSVDPDLCTRCKKCITVCPSGAIKMVEKDNITIPEQNYDLCIHCTTCVNHCPTRAIANEKLSQRSPYLFKNVVETQGETRIEPLREEIVEDAKEEKVEN
eukprot:TRINITY_DN3191_c2_g1_i1.p1 TRINITY_DN3191_c2_g1~~TRINITY_DN3191_c2_g1_i1.p1  ORF type:complete len:297 (-),score=84.78 TRINITY_DN3191_c2_g1_i1:106-996(-)